MAHRPPNAPRKQSRGSFLLGVFVGLLIGLGMAAGIAWYLNKTPIPFLTRKPAADKPAGIAGMPTGKAPAGEKPRFDFYKILPGGEEQVSDKELKAAPKDAPESAVYFLQAGSFQNPADADNRKAQLAILGFEAAVEPIALPDKGTWYRVRLGPFTQVDEINNLRSTLAQNGIDVSLVKVKAAGSARSN